MLFVEPLSSTGNRELEACVLKPVAMLKTNKTWSPSAMQYGVTFHAYQLLRQVD